MGIYSSIQSERTFDLGILVNEKKLPVAIFKDGKLSNIEILDWADVGNGKMDGRGLVWIEKENAKPFLGANDFKPKTVWGEVRLGVSKIGDQLGPMIFDPPEKEDSRYIHE